MTKTKVGQVRLSDAAQRLLVAQLRATTEELQESNVTLVKNEADFLTMLRLRDERIAELESKLTQACNRTEELNIQIQGANRSRHVLALVRLRFLSKIAELTSQVSILTAQLDSEVRTNRKTDARLQTLQSQLAEMTQLREEARDELNTLLAAMEHDSTQRLNHLTLETHRDRT